MANTMDAISGLSNLRKLALAIELIFYFVGGYGVAGFSFSSGLAIWLVVLILALWSGLFGALGWALFNVNTSQS
jgi:hypothetical protein